MDRAYNIYWSRPLLDPIPVLRGTKLRRAPGGESQVVNVDLRTSSVTFDKTWIDHYNVEDHRGVQDLVMRQIMQAIDPRMTTAETAPPVTEVHH